MGTGGKLAVIFASTLKELWYGSSTSVSPWDIKKVIGQHASQFTGYSQHDSHELLTFLLDGIHEDLNRVKQKPYVELKDDEGRPDAEFAVERWENHIMRNQSVVVDLMHGQYKSVLTCPICNKISVAFDPFLTVTLPIPQTQEANASIYYVRVDNSEWPVKVTFRTRMDSTLGAEKSSISALVSCENFVYVSISNDEIKQVLDESTLFSDLKQVTLFAFECPKDIDQYIMIELRILRLRRGIAGFPRIIFIPKAATLSNLHLQIFDYFLKHYAKVPTKENEKIDFYRSKKS